MSGRCDWCGGVIPAGSRRDAITCSKRCRQARHRFRRGVVADPAATDRRSPRDVSRVDPRRLLDRGATARIAYADPPYPGMAARYYADHPGISRAWSVFCEPSPSTAAAHDASRGDGDRCATVGVASLDGSRVDADPHATDLPRGLGDGSPGRRDASLVEVAG